MAFFQVDFVEWPNCTIKRLHPKLATVKPVFKSLSIDASLPCIWDERRINWTDILRSAFCKPGGCKIEVRTLAYIRCCIVFHVCWLVCIEKSFIIVCTVSRHCIRCILLLKEVGVGSINECSNPSKFSVQYADSFISHPRLVNVNTTLNSCSAYVAFALHTNLLIQVRR